MWHVYSFKKDFFIHFSLYTEAALQIWLRVFPKILNVKFVKREICLSKNAYIIDVNDNNVSLGIVRGSYFHKKLLRVGPVYCYYDIIILMQKLYFFNICFIWSISCRNYIFKVNNKNSWKMHEIFQKLQIKTPHRPNIMLFWQLYQCF